MKWGRKKGWGREREVLRVETVVRRARASRWILLLCDGFLLRVETAVKAEANKRIFVPLHLLLFYFNFATDKSISE